MGQQVPEYSESDFERVLAREFPSESVAEAREILLRYGKESYESWPLRVRMGCLKLAGGEIAQLKKMVKVACGDPRDLLAAAEYRRSWDAKGAAAQFQAAQEDWKELQEWLARK